MDTEIKCADAEEQRLIAYGRTWDQILNRLFPTTDTERLRQAMAERGRSKTDLRPRRRPLKRSR